MIFYINRIQRYMNSSEHRVIEYLEKQYVVDDAISSIWVQRFNDLGEFELVLPSRYLEYKCSYVNCVITKEGDDESAMLVEKVDVEFSEEDGYTLKLSGRSVLALLASRILINGYEYLAQSEDDHSLSLATIIDNLLEDNIFSATSGACLLLRPYRQEYDTEEEYDKAYDEYEKVKASRKIDLFRHKEFVASEHADPYTGEIDLDTSTIVSYPPSHVSWKFWADKYLEGDSRWQVFNEYKYIYSIRPSAYICTHLFFIKGLEYVEFSIGVVTVGNGTDNITITTTTDCTVSINHIGFANHAANERVNCLALDTRDVDLVAGVPTTVANIYSKTFYPEVEWYTDLDAKKDPAEALKNIFPCAVLSDKALIYDDDGNVVTSETVFLRFERGQNLWEVISSLLKTYNVGIKATADGEREGRFTIDFYSPTDRSKAQTTNSWVIFSPEFENLANSSFVWDIFNNPDTCIVDSDYYAMLPTSEEIMYVATPDTINNRLLEGESSIEWYSNSYYDYNDGVASNFSIDVSGNWLKNVYVATEEEPSEGSRYIWTQLRELKEIPVDCVITLLSPYEYDHAVTPTSYRHLVPDNTDYYSSDSWTGISSEWEIGSHGYTGEGYLLEKNFTEPATSDGSKRITHLHLDISGSDIYETYFSTGNTERIGYKTSRYTLNFAIRLKRKVKWKVTHAKVSKNIISTDFERYDFMGENVHHHYGINRHETYIKSDGEGEVLSQYQNYIYSPGFSGEPDLYVVQEFYQWYKVSMIVDDSSFDNTWMKKAYGNDFVREWTIENPYGGRTSDTSYPFGDLTSGGNQDLIMQWITDEFGLTRTNPSTTDKTIIAKILKYANVGLSPENFTDEYFEENGYFVGMPEYGDETTYMYASAYTNPKVYFETDGNVKFLVNTVFGSRSIEQSLGRQGSQELKNIAQPSMECSGELLPYTQWEFGKDYNLGDYAAVEFPQVAAMMTGRKTQITEYTEVEDGEGYRAYPTFSDWIGIYE